MTVLSGLSYGGHSLVDWRVENYKKNCEDRDYFLKLAVKSEAKGDLSKAEVYLERALKADEMLSTGRWSRF